MNRNSSFPRRFLLLLATGLFTITLVTWFTRQREALEGDLATREESRAETVDSTGPELQVWEASARIEAETNAAGPGALPTEQAPIGNSAGESPGLSIREMAEEDGSFVDMSLAELRAEQFTLNDQLTTITTPIYRELRDAGRFEVVGTIDNHKGVTSKDRDLLLSLEYDGPTGQVRRIEIPQMEFPAAYALKRRLLLVEAEIRRRAN